MAYLKLRTFRRKGYHFFLQILTLKLRNLEVDKSHFSHFQQKILNEKGYKFGMKQKLEQELHQWHQCVDQFSWLLSFFLMFSFLHFWFGTSFLCVCLIVKKIWSWTEFRFVYVWSINVLFFVVDSLMNRFW